jgi:hypothetical protein
MQKDDLVFVGHMAMVRRDGALCDNAGSDSEIRKRRRAQNISFGFRSSV